jgi:hypothetical protein
MCQELVEQVEKDQFTKIFCAYFKEKMRRDGERLLLEFGTD